MSIPVCETESWAGESSVVAPTLFCRAFSTAFKGTFRSFLRLGIHRWLARCLSFQTHTELIAGQMRSEMDSVQYQ